ncbi:TetR/AcrR family transcriptional regulator [Staphylococcus shinii]|uniref:TetR/AcrR family transcriptional regulator n=1 Tax=Staphylococcus shinii TaxID=2912228 RepID=UPI003F85D7D3
MKHDDLRVIKTKQALSRSFFQLLKEKKFSNITVRNICDFALVHRTTFYQHFLDKYDLLFYLINLFTKDYFSTNIQKRVNSPFTVMSEVFNKTDELQVIKTKQDDDREFSRASTNHFIQLLQKDVLENQQKIVTPPGIPIELAFYIYESSLSGFTEWIQSSQTSLKPEKIDELFHKTINIRVKNN